MMTILTSQPSPNASDYGDFGNDEEELEILEQLLIQAEADIEDAPRLRLPKVLGFEMRSHKILCNHIAKKRASASPEPPVPDNRSPLERFRTPPRKALSVTDLVSPSWCELQYYYVLSKHGRKRRTKAMKQGTAVHQALEDEVHMTVPVEVSKKEDSWGLRIWNIIQGLRTLRTTGRTRELEIWGVVGGEIVNGIIDELSYECPGSKDNMQSLQIIPPEYQTSITEYLTSEEGGIKTDSTKKQIYITDIKTRGHPTLPTGSSIRPTILQLHLYHHMLENLAQGNFHLSQLVQRYDLDATESFSDSFIAQLGSLNQELSQASFVPGDEHENSQITHTQDSMDILLEHNNLSSLWDFMMNEFQVTFLPRDNNDEPTPTPQSVSDLPVPSQQPTILSPLLTAEYLAPTYTHAAEKTKKSIGKKSFGFNATYLRTYLEDNLQWWRGERKARGVELQEAWKCRNCDFRDDCEWIHERDAAAFNEAMERKKMREIAGVDAKGIDRSNV